MISIAELYKTQPIHEELKIKHKNWDLVLPGFIVEINDKDTHSILSRKDSRTELTANLLKDKLQKGINYIGKKLNKGFFEADTMVALNYVNSNFTALILVKPKGRYIRVSSILDSTMKTRNAIKWTINEFNSLFPEYANEVNELVEDSTTSSLLNYSLLLEQNVDSSEFCVYSDDLLIIDID